VSATAQIQKSPFNRVFVDEDYQYTEQARRVRGVSEHMLKGLKFHKAGNHRAAAEAFAVVVTLDPSVFDAQYNLGISQLFLGDGTSM
jgi:hypothetical protein